MLRSELETLRLRVDVLVEVVAALARLMPPERAAEAQVTMTHAVARRLKGVSLSDAADRTVAADLARLVDVGPFHASQTASPG